jgi:uncharacterized protein
VKEKWYKDGLRFRCTGCGKCCSGVPGYVWVTEDEMLVMAEYLNISLLLFKRKYTRQKNNQYSLIELRDHNYSCIFLRDNQCLVYPVRPIQCKTYPWWKENLKSKESWECAKGECEGLNDDEAPLFTQEEIDNVIEHG